MIVGFSGRFFGSICMLLFRFLNDRVGKIVLVCIGIV